MKVVPWDDLKLFYEHPPLILSMRYAVRSAFFQEIFWGPVGASPFRESSNANIIVNTI